MIPSKNRIATVLSLAILTLAMTGCWAFPISLFEPGIHWSGTLECTAVVLGPDDSRETLDFEYSTVLLADEAGDFALDHIDLAPGEEVTRSIGTADLAFEITRAMRIGPLITVQYVPRATLPGIRVTGDLFETYRWTARPYPSAVQASASADLRIMDTEGATNLSIECSGHLWPSQP